MSPEEFPSFFAEADWSMGTCESALVDAPPPDHLIGNVNLVPFVGPLCVVIPDFYCFVGCGEVELVSGPQPVEGGERGMLVELVPVEGAARRFIATGRADLADLYRLAAAVRQEWTQPEGTRDRPYT